MNDAANEKGIAVLCDGQGRVRSVVRNDLDWAARLSPGQSLLHWVDPVNAEKARQFLLALQKQQAAFDWEIFVRWQGELTALHFAGGRAKGGFLIIVARTRLGLARLNDELMRINNEQMNALRATAKELAMTKGCGARNGPGSRPRDGHGDPYDELTRVNNDLANLQRELFKKNVELARLNDEKNRFLGIAAHDLRSPLGVILNYSEFLEEDLGPRLSPEEHEFVSMIKQTSRFLVGLIDDLLDVSQIEAGQLHLDLQPTDLAELLRENVARNRVLAEKKHIRLKLTVTAALPALWIDPGKFEQVLYNLLGNAVKFSHPQTEIRVRLTREGEQAVLTVTDQGQGIPEQELPKLFKPFCRTGVRSTGGEACTGLGLWIVRRIVEGHHGSVEVESVVGQGSTFQVRLPLGHPAEPAEKKPPGSFP